jgi:hypothetical protein
MGWWVGMGCWRRAVATRWCFIVLLFGAAAGGYRWLMRAAAWNAVSLSRWLCCLVPAPQVLPLLPCQMRPLLISSPSLP